MTYLIVNGHRSSWTSAIPETQPTADDSPEILFEEAPNEIPCK